MIGENELKKVARLARLELTEEEMKVYPQQLSAILGYFEQISKVDTKGVEPLITPSEIVQILRPDEAQVWDHMEEALANAPERSGNLFKVPPVV